jgi:BASS family bile acid:Na+ symporter
MLQLLIRLFPIWAVLLGTLAFWEPQPFIAARQAIMPLLALIMFSMGLTLTVEDFKRVVRMPGVILLGVLMQFGLMPLLAWLIAASLQMSPLLAAGLILVGACPGGTASNVVTYLAGGNVALSITLTVVSTLLAVFMTPWLSWLFIDTTVAVPTLAMLKSILSLVIAPVMGGLLLNHYLHRWVRRLHTLCPLVAVTAIVIIIAIVVALNHSQLAGMSLLVALAVVVHNLAGLTLGYGIGRLMGYPEVMARTLAIEVGMQNSGLAVALALKYFAPLAALPGALFSVWHNLSGAMLAALWQRGRRQEN